MFASEQHSLQESNFDRKPVNRYEERALRMWGDEEIEENWDAAIG